ncbi:hypothetical protein ABZ814_08325 [Micromonospora musae]|uniref:hypothetical protein n=1 Tax=Micromonospora musae TaxID=1894970 RepID=UPI0033FB39DE
MRCARGGRWWAREGWWSACEGWWSAREGWWCIAADVQAQAALRAGPHLRRQQHVHVVGEGRGMVDAMQVGG